MVSGSVASIEYGEPRATLDIDLVMLLNRETSLALDTLFPPDAFYLPPTEVREVEFKRSNRGHFNIIHHSSGLKADCYPSRNHPYLAWAMQNRRRIPLMGVDILIAAHRENYERVIRALSQMEDGAHQKQRNLSGPG